MLKARRLAIEHFEETGELPKNRGKHEYCLHHKDPSWRYTDPERYYAYNWEDLEVVTYKGHSDKHPVWNKGLKMEQSKSEETRKKLADAQKGKHQANDGVHNVWVRELPPGYTWGWLK